MTNRSFVVRVVQAKEKPEPIFVRKIDPAGLERKIHPAVNIFTGSGLGILAGLAIFGLLKITGLPLGSTESYFIIGLPAVLGTFTSFAVF